MSHDYSVQVHNWITQKIELVETQKISAEKRNDTEVTEYLAGQLEELLFFQDYLAKHIDLKTQTYF